MLPPWEKYPDIKHNSIGWRMGRGEDYFNSFYPWFSSLDQNAKDNYKRDHPEPASWLGFYKTVIDNP